MLSIVFRSFYVYIFLVYIQIVTLINVFNLTCEHPISRNILELFVTNQIFAEWLSFEVLSKCMQATFRYLSNQ